MGTPRCGRSSAFPAPAGAAGQHAPRGDGQHDLVGGDRSGAYDALKAAVVYSRSSEVGATGLSVYHPMHNKAVYAVKWRKDYAGLSFGSGYKQYVTAITKASLPKVRYIP